MRVTGRDTELAIFHDEHRALAIFRQPVGYGEPSRAAAHNNVVVLLFNIATVEEYPRSMVCSRLRQAGLPSKR